MKPQKPQIVDFRALVPDQVLTAEPWTFDSAAGAADSAACRVCSAALPAREPGRSGRPRVTCSLVCRRRRDALTRWARRRLAWRAGWIAAGRRGLTDPDEVRREVAALDTDIAQALRDAGRTRAELDDDDLSKGDDDDTSDTA